MRILLVITKGSWGGATRYVFDLASSLHKKNISVAVAFGGEGALSQKLEYEGIEHFQIPSLARDINFEKEVLAYKELYSVIKKFNPDIVHVNSSKGGLAALAAKRLGKKVVFSIHGWAFNEQRNPISKLVIKIIYLATIAFSDKVILVSEALKKQILHWPQQNKLEVIHNGVSFKEPLKKQDARTALIKKFPALESCAEATWLVSVSELHRNKGVDIGIASLAELRDRRKELPHYIIFGDGEERWRLEKLIQSYNVQDFVHLLGFVEDAQQYISSGDIFILPSRTEALGYVLLEAGLAKVPAIATRVGGVPEIIESGINGLLVPPNSGTTLAVAIEKILSEKKVAKEMSENLYKKVSTKFSLEEMVKRTESIYLKTLRA